MHIQYKSNLSFDLCC